MNKQFDPHEARKFLERREKEFQQEEEEVRKAVLLLVSESLKKIFQASSVEVYLIGSITQPGMFNSSSDIDVVLKNFTGDRFEVWTQLEALVKRNVEVILFENCTFQQHILKNGYRIV